MPRVGRTQGESVSEPSRKGIVHAFVPLGMKAARPAIVVCEGWHVWLGILPSLGYLLEYVYVPMKLKLYIQDLEQFEKTTWIGLDQAKGAQLDCPGTLFVSGLLKFVQNLVSQHKVDLLRSVLLVARDRRNKGRLQEDGMEVEWLWIKHTNVGGITDAEAMVGIGWELPQPCWEDIEAGKLPQNLIHVFRPSESSSVRVVKNPG